MSGTSGRRASNVPTRSQIEHGKIAAPEGRVFPKYGSPERPRRPVHIKSVMNLTSERGNPLCGSVIRRPGKHGDWLCHQKSVGANGRCKMHGARTIGKPKDGAGRQWAALRALGVSEMFNELRNDPELVELRNQVALSDVEMIRALERLHKDDSAEHRKELREIIQGRRKLVDSIHRNESAVVPVERVLAFMHAMVNITFEFLHDAREKTAFLAKVRAIRGLPTDRIAGRAMIDTIPKTVEEVAAPKADAP